VACVRDEAALARERGFEAPEHAVQRLPETVDLVPRGWKRESAARLGGGDGLRLASHRLHRAKCGGGESVAGERGDQKGKGPSDQERQEQASQGFLAVLERRADDDHGPSSRRVDGGREQSCGFVRAGNAAARDLDRRGLGARGFSVREKRAPEPARRVDDGAVRVEDLGKALSPLGESRVALTYERRDVRRALPKALIDRSVESGAEAQVEEQTRGREDDGHRNREGERQAEADGHSREVTHDAHPPPSARSR